MAAEPRHLLREASERGDTDSIDSLLREQMGILDATCGRTAWTALHAAADRGRLESLRHLLGMRADPNLRTASGATALSLASRSGHLDCVQALLQVGAEPTEATGKNATTALHGAMRLDRTEVVRTLITQGADPDQKTVAGVTARDLGGVEPLEQYSWQPHTASEILRDPYYLSETELAERYPPLESMIHSELYAAEARRAVIDAAGGGVVEQGAREVAEAEEALAAERERAEHEKASLEMALAAVRTTTAPALPVFFAAAKPSFLHKPCASLLLLSLAVVRRQASAAEVNAEAAKAAVARQRALERADADRARRAEEQQRQKRFDRMKAESESRAKQLMDAFVRPTHLPPCPAPTGLLSSAAGFTRLVCRSRRAVVSRALRWRRSTLRRKLSMRHGRRRQGRGTMPQHRP